MTLTPEMNTVDVERKPEMVSIDAPYEPSIVPIEPAMEVQRVHLGWRTWVVVFVSAYLTIFMQIFTTVAAPSTIAFIVQDLGNQSMSAWVLQAPLLVQAVLNPVIGRLSDTLDRKMLVTITPLIAFAGSVMSARANNMNLLIAGGVLYGITLSTLSIVQSIPAEILPLKYRTIASGIAFVGGTSGGLVGGLVAGAFCRTTTGWRNMFWVQAALQLLVSVCFFIFYWPPKTTRAAPRMKLGEILWACDPIGSFLFIGGSTSVLMALNWASGAFPWHNTRVAGPLSIGLLCLLLFGFYEWKGRSDGLIAHDFFRSGPNFPLSVFACAVEGWMYYSAVNTIMNQMIFYLDWETDSLLIGVRQIAYSGPALVASIFVIWYSTRYKEVKIPLVVCFIFFLAVACAFAALKSSWNHIQLGLGALAGVGQSGPLTLLIAVVQFAAPHDNLSTATGVAFSFRAIGGAFGSAILYTIAFGHVAAYFDSDVAQAAVSNGLPPTDVPILLQVMAEGHGPPTEQALTGVLSKVLPSATQAVIKAARSAGHNVYAKGFALAWTSIIPIVVLAIVCCALLKGVDRLMTERVEAPLENAHSEGDVKTTE